MNWFTLLKQPKLRVDNKVTTNLGSKSESQDDNCERKVREYADKVGNYSQTGSDLQGYSSLDDIDEPNLPEEVYCKILSQLNRIQPNTEISESIKVNDVEYDVEVLYFYYPSNEEASMMVKVDESDKSTLPLYFVLDYDNTSGKLSEEEALRTVDFR
jgi:hypothetical protein